MYPKNLGFSAALGTVLAFLLVPEWSVFAQSTVPSREEMWRIIQSQQKEIQQLKEKLNMVVKDIATTEERIEIIADSPVLESKPSWADKTNVGGYGELHFNSLTNTRDGGGGDKDEIDFHRFVLFFGHEFNDRIRFFSELEVEHGFLKDNNTDTDTAAGSSPNPNKSNGEVELEQAYIDMDITENHTFRAGQFLIPVGILNETHEPPTFYGVERNNVEKHIIPTTWWEGGVGLHGQLAPELGLSYDLTYTSGLSTGAGFAIRGGRQRVSKAKADKAAYTARLKLNRPGFELATTLHHQSDLSQEGGAVAGDGPVRADLWEIHTILEKGPFGIRALYARWNIDSQTASATGVDEQYGWYAEPSLKLNKYLGLFARYSVWDTSAGNHVANGTGSFGARTKQFDAGINWWPHENVVLKLDYQKQIVSPTASTQLEGFNVGVGYSF